MLKRKFMIGFVAVAALVLGMQASVFAKKKQATFKVRIENISNSNGLAAADGKTLYLCARSGLYKMRLNIEGVSPNQAK
jgi:hypothetical protein